MQRFLLKLSGYLGLLLIIVSAAIYVGILKRPEFFLGTYAPDYFLVNYQYNKIEGKSGFRNIITGDSRGCASVDPRILGSSWINLSIPGSDFFEGFITLKRYLAQNKVDTFVMVYGGEYIEGKSPYFAERTIPFQFAQMGDLKGLENVERKWGGEFHGNRFLGGRIGSVRLKVNQLNRRLTYLHFPLEYRATFWDALDRYITSYNEVQGKTASKLKQIKDGRGHICFGVYDSSSSITDSANNRVFVRNEIDLAYLDSIMNLAAKNNIQCYLFIAPINQTTYKFYENHRYLNSMNELLSGVALKYPQLKISGQSSMPNNSFGDDLHLNERGCKAFTLQISNKMH